MSTMMIRGLLRGVGVRGRRQRRRICYFSSASFSASASISTSSSKSDLDTIEFFDVTIVGGGVVGLSLANLLRRELPNLKVALIDSKQEPPLPSLSQPATATSNDDGTDQKNKQQQQPQITRIPNPRSYALSPRSFQVLGSAI